MVQINLDDGQVVFLQPIMRNEEGDATNVTIDDINELIDSINNMGIGVQRVEMFEEGKRYWTVGGELVRIVGTSNIENAPLSYQTVFDQYGRHRYSQRDFGRVTGTGADCTENNLLPFALEDGNTGPIVVTAFSAQEDDEWEYGEVLTAKFHLTDELSDF